MPVRVMYPAPQTRASLVGIELEREITISGTVRNTVDGKDLVIAAESMSLKQY